MDALILMVVCGVGYLVAYHTYGRFLARKIFKLRADAPVPSQELQDGIDYVPTRKGIIFGHHYTSIAGTGPIVGPAIGIIWGWLPAILWVTVGCIFMGAVHDLGTLVVSLRNEGKSISEIAARYINKRVRLILFFVVFLALLIVIAIFGLVIAVVFKAFPSSLAPVWLQIPIAMVLGYAIYKKSANVFLSTAIAVALMYITIWLGSKTNFVMSEILGIPPTGVWTIIILIYGWVASTLPVTMLLQPRDYINAWQLFIIMGMLAVGVAASSIKGNLEIIAPAVNLSPAGAPSLWPFLFVTIACGAISGFHSLVASGTSPKQISKEPDAQFVGYGSMLLEGLLAVLVILCVGAGITMGVKALDGKTILTGADAWNRYYSSWMGERGLEDNVAPVVSGAANMMVTFGLPESIGITLMGVFIASFAGTTLDTAVRIQRYIIGELTTDLKMPALSNRWTATTIAVGTAAALAFINGASGAGAKTLWPLFGIANQLLAALALLIVTMYLRQKGGIKFIITAIPALIMLTIAVYSMVIKERDFIANFRKDWLLVVIGSVLFVLALWVAVETVIVFFTVRRSDRPEVKV
ncbi:MAG: carbon starvation protein A [Sedimentisphaerales bacterium]|nr:carbon starvation protein A [Sedimentisphaerales bacterium]